MARRLRQLGDLHQSLALAVRMLAHWSHPLLAAGKGYWHAARQASVDLLYPPSCLQCRRELFANEHAILFCEPCREQLIDPRPACPNCGAGLAAETARLDECPHCRGVKFRFNTVVGLGSYDSPLHRSIVRAKDKRHVAIAMQLARLLVHVRGSALRALPLDGVVPVPAHWSRRLHYGHNSAEVVAATIAGKLNVPLAIGVLVRRRATRPQRELPPTQRRQNVRDAFAVCPHKDLPGARLLLVDDVLTTGATANEATKALLAAGAAQVSVAVLARAVGGR